MGGTGEARLAGAERDRGIGMKGYRWCPHRKQCKSQPGKIVSNIIHNKELVTHEKHSFKLIKINS